MASNTTSTSLLADDQLWSKDLFLVTGLLIMYAVAGSLGNLLIIIVYFRAKDQRNTSIFIKLLAIIDATVCLFVIPYTIVFLMHLIRQNVMCQLFEFIRHFSIITSNFTLVAVAVERFVAVCRPTRRLTMGSVKIIIILIIVISALMSVPPLKLYAVVSDGPNKISPQFVTTTFLPYLVKLVPKHDFCQFTPSILGLDITLAYHVMLAVIFLGTVISITILYSITYGVLWKRSRIQRVLRCTDARIDPPMQRKCSLLEAMAVDESDKKLCSNKTNLNEPFSKQIDDELISKENGLPENVLQLSMEGISHHNQILTINKIGNDNMRKRCNSKYSRRRLGRYHCHRTAKMLFLCTLIYLFTWIPYWLDTFEITDILILKYMFFLGNATNPIIYGIVNQNVRSQIRKLVS